MPADQASMHIQESTLERQPRFSVPPFVGPIARVTRYIRLHGMGATLRRAWLGCKRTLTQGRMILYYCDLPSLQFTSPEIGLRCTLERKRLESEVDAADLEQISTLGPTKLVRQQVSARFAQQASLWLIRAEGKLVGFGWTIRGKTVLPHYFPLEPDDLHLFDFHVFEAYRGRRINLVLMSSVLTNLATESKGRAYWEVAEWNAPQLKSMSRTPAQKLGVAQKFCLFGKTIVIWTDPPRL